MKVTFQQVILLSNILNDRPTSFEWYTCIHEERERKKSDTRKRFTILSRFYETELKR